MAVAVSYPGVYIEEVPSGARAIAGVPTSVAAFVGYTARGPVNQPVQIFSFADFERRFGGVHRDSDLSYAVDHFFLNGGGTAWIVRVAANAAAASVDLLTAPGGAVTLTARAKSEGQWGNALIIEVDYATSNPASLFNLTVTEMSERNGQLLRARSETHRNLSMNSFSGNYVVEAVNAASDLIELEDHEVEINSQGSSESGLLTDDVTDELNDDQRRLAISLDGGPIYEFDLFDEGGSLEDLAAVAAAIQSIVRTQLEPGTEAFDDFTCAAAGKGLRAESGTAAEERERSSVRFASASTRSAAAVLRLGLANGGRERQAAADRRPAASGTAGGHVDDFGSLAFEALSQMVVRLHNAAGDEVDGQTVTLANADTAAPTTLEETRRRIEAALRGGGRVEFSGARVRVVDNALVLIPGGSTFSNHFEIADAEDAGNPATNLSLTSDEGAAANVAAYQLGVGPSTQAQQAGTGGNDGSFPGSPELLGSRADKTGIFALQDVRLFNILNLPAVSDVGVLEAAIAYAEERRSMILIDMPATVNSFEGARDWIENTAPRHRNAVAYFPRVRLADPLQNNRVRSFPNSGVIAGLFARTDNSRGVWKAPAGIEARLRGVQELEYVLSDPQNGILNPLGLNCLRVFPVFGSVCWGARTLMGADELANEWKYVPVRRLALFIEESLYRGTQFAVFEPNDEPLWAELRLAVGSFMNNLFRQGAFQGSTPQAAYLVRCDATTTTQADIDLGIVNILVGFAPLKPAEFVIIQIQQLAGQSQA